MKAFVSAVAIGLFCLLEPSVTLQSSPQVQVYSRFPSMYGKSNVLICHVSGFYPPEISIELFKNGELIPSSQQSDLAFEENWFYYMTKHVPFTSYQGDVYTCRVTHLGKEKIYHFESDL